MKRAFTLVVVLVASLAALHAPRAANAAKPNVLLIISDDLTATALSCYGNNVCRTPNIDRLASGGLRYSNFHTTSLCSPSRACLLTGHNHHTNHLGVISEAATGYPGYDGRMPRSQVTDGCSPCSRCHNVMTSKGGEA